MLFHMNIARKKFREFSHQAWEGLNNTAFIFSLLLEYLGNTFVIRQKSCFRIEDIYIGKSALLLQLHLLKIISTLEEVKTRILISEGSPEANVV